MVSPGHLDSVLCVDIGPHRKYAVSAGKDKTARVWDLDSGRQLRVLKGHTEIVTTVAFGPTGKYILTGSYDETIRLWDMHSGKEIKCLKEKWPYADGLVGIRKTIKIGIHQGNEEKLPIEKGITTATFSLDGKSIISGCQNGTINIWDIETGKIKKKLKGHSGAVHALSIHPTMERLASGSEDKTIRIWDLKTGECLQSLIGPKECILSIAFHPHGNQIIASGYGKDIILWELKGGTIDSRIKGHPEFTSSVRFSPDGNHIISGGSDAKINIWNYNTKKIENTLNGHRSYVNSISTDARGKYIFSGGRDNTCFLWHINSRRPIKSFNSCLDRIQQNIKKAAFTHDDKMICVSSGDGYIHLWDTKRAILIKSLPAGNAEITDFLIKNDSSQIVSGSEDGNLRILDLYRGITIKTFPVNKHGINALVFSNDEHTVITGGADEIIRVMNLNDGKLIFKLDGHLVPINSMAYNSRGNKLYSAGKTTFNKPPRKSYQSAIDRYLGGRERLLRLWNMEDKKELPIQNNRFKGHTDTINKIVFSEALNSLFTAGDDGRIIRWNLETGKRQKRYEGHTGTVNALAVSKDGKYLASGGKDRTIRLWDCRSGKNIKIFKGKQGIITTLDFNAKSNRLVSGGDDGSIKIWDLDNLLEIVRCYRFPNGEWISLTPDNYYASSPEASDLIYWRFPKSLETYSFSQFEIFFRRPEIIQRRLFGKKDAGKPIPPLKQPPKLLFEDHLEIFRATTKQYTIRYQVESQNTVKKTCIFVNGKPAVSQHVDKKQKVFEHQVDLDSGLSRITIIAFDDSGFSSNPKYVDIIQKNTDTKKPDLYLLTVGISHYPNLPSVWQLDYAHSDAQAIAKTLKGQEGKIFSKVAISQLLNENATKGAITRSIKELNAAQKEDVTIIYLAGHGIQDKNSQFQFLTSTYNMSSPHNNSLSWETLKGCVRQLKGRVILLLDACHSGRVVDRYAAPNDDLAEFLFAKDRGGIMVFSASKGRQNSIESNEFGSGFGIFTYALVKGLNGNEEGIDKDFNGFIEFSELIDYVKNYVTVETKGLQTPWLSRKEMFGDFPIAIVSN
ncbi:hypothetical protein DSCO28_54240 [Desulfosarcina ovata subsp. sediminis]|uniref:Peptidase C14 caspase domain-containing protein n=2 Tax=Desulfosarcina ovata TaxID=83564 RepID=A0A5K7ZXA4_9BACT|nr:hypothetical protein DSCO28_54240 [Desulfosarcina ovata subsp. sediminis]